MDTQFKLQMDVRNNAEDLQNYVLDLHNWEKEMKKKEMSLDKESPNPSRQNIPPPRNKLKHSSKVEKEKAPSSNAKKKISGYDYSAWDKFDVDKACAELDEEGSGEEDKSEENEVNEEAVIENQKDSNSEQDKLSLIDEAFYEKELGNQFVKKEDWNSAIKCYTKAINLDVRNPIYYANRSLCFLKLKNFKSAEVDATVAIQLDKNYTKAYQRRAYSRLALGQLVESKSDFEAVLNLEPKNSLAQFEINKIDERLKKESKIGQSDLPKKTTFNHKDLFKTDSKPEIKKDNSSKSESVKPKSSKSDSKISQPSNEAPKPKPAVSNVKREEVPVKSGAQLNLDGGGGGDGDKKIQGKAPSIFNELPEHCRIINPIKLPPHKRSKKPLKRIDIMEIDEDEEDISESKSTTPSDLNKKQKNISSKSEELKPQESINFKKYDSDLLQESVFLDDPKTAIQFEHNWKIIRDNPDKAYKYLKKVSGTNLPRLFQHSLESSFFSDLVTFLTEDVTSRDLDLVYSYLEEFTKVKRFTSLILFLTKKEKESLAKCFDKLKKVKTEDDVSRLQRLYEV